MTDSLEDIRRAAEEATRRSRARREQRRAEREVWLLGVIIVAGTLWGLTIITLATSMI